MFELAADAYDQYRARIPDGPIVIDAVAWAARGQA
jgi:hypothetical protein